MKQLVPFGLVLLGLVLVVISLLWTTLFSGGPALGQEDYARLEELETKVVELYRQIETVKARTGNDSAAEEASVGYRRAIEERDALRAKLESGLSQPSSTAATLRYVGIALLLVGIVGSLVFKPE